MKKNLVAFCTLMLVLLIFSGCSQNLENGSISVTLPYGISRSADDSSEYSYKITVEQGDKTRDSRRGKSGETITFNLLPGDYTVKGEAWNEQTVYQGEAQASVSAGENSDVQLKMSDATRTEHIKASPCEDGVMFTVISDGDDIDALEMYVYTESEWSVTLWFEDNKISDGTQFYFPFTKKGEKCTFSFITNDGKTETGYAIAGGGHCDIFKSETFGLKPTLDEKGIVHFDEDPVEWLYMSKAQEEISNFAYRFGLIGHNASGDSPVEFYKTEMEDCLLISDGKYNKNLNESLMKNGFNIIEQAKKSPDMEYTFNTFNEFEKCNLELEANITFTKWPTQTFRVGYYRAPTVKTPKFTFDSTSENITASSDENGIKLSLTSENESVYASISVPGEFLLEVPLYDSEFNTIQKMDIYYPFTKKGETYSFKCQIYDTDDNNKTEWVSAVAGGGIEGLFTGSIEDVKLNLSSDKITLNKNPLEIFASDKLSSLVETVEASFDFYAIDNLNDAGSYRGNFITTKNIRIYGGNDETTEANPSTNLNDLLETGFLKNNWLDTDLLIGGRGSDNRIQDRLKLPYLWVSGGLEFTLKKWPSQKFQFNSRYFSCENNVIEMPDFS